MAAKQGEAPFLLLLLHPSQCHTCLARCQHGNCLLQGWATLVLECQCRSWFLLRPSLVTGICWMITCLGILDGETQSASSCVVTGLDVVKARTDSGTSCAGLPTLQATASVGAVA